MSVRLSRGNQDTWTVEVLAEMLKEQVLARRLFFDAVIPSRGGYISPTVRALPCGALAPQAGGRD
jgi:hypothetical protein